MEMVESKRKSEDFCGISFNPDHIVENLSGDASEYLISKTSAEFLRAKSAYLKDWSVRVKEDNVVGGVILRFYSDAKVSFAIHPDHLVNHSEDLKLHLMAASSFPLSLNQLNTLNKLHVSARAFVSVLGSNQDAAAEEDEEPLILDEYRSDIDGFVHLTKENLENGILGQLEAHIQENVYIVEGLKPEYALSPNKPTEPIFIPNDGRTIDVFLAYAFKVDEDARDLIGNYAAPLVKVLSLQYELFFARAASRFATPKTIHAYPLVDTSIPFLASLNTAAFLRTLNQFFPFSPSINIYFHYDAPFADLASSVPQLTAFIGEVQLKFNVRVEELSAEEDAVTIRVIN